MRNSDADIAINTLNKLIAQEYEAASAGMRYGNRSLEESASIRYHAYLNARDKIAVSWKFKVVPLTYTTDRDAWTLTLNNAGTLESLLSEGWSVVRTDVLPGLNGKGEYKVPPNTCFEPSLPPTLVYILGKEAE